MKTYDEWLKNDEFLVDWLEPGDEVDQAMVDNLRETQRLRINTQKYLQIADAVKVFRDIRGRHPCYMTFCNDDGHWIYIGCREEGEVIRRELRNG